MKISVFFHHLEMAAKEKNCSIPEIFAWAKALGIDYVEFDRDGIGNAKKMKKMLDKAGLMASSVYGFFDWDKGADKDKVERLFEAAKILESKRMMVIPGFYHGADREKEQAGFLREMTAFCERADREGYTVTIEDFDSETSPIATIAGQKYFADRIPTLGITLDTGNYIYSCDDVLEATKVFAGKIAHVHCKDRRLEPGTGEVLKALDGTDLYPSAVGSGCIPMETVVETMKAAGFDGCFVMEFFGSDNYVGMIEASAEWMKEKLG